MGPLHEKGMKFTGEGGIKVKEFLGWMESWFAMMGDEFSGETPRSQAMQVAQLHLAYPVRSAAGRFISSLERDVLWDEKLFISKKYLLRPVLLVRLTLQKSIT